uniref:Uncharacterized protein n=1 Tax=Cucumis sativus TaxID=3659 RepID=A0A0A0KC65_CUCSA
MEAETALAAILGRLGRHCYAVLCLGVLLLTVAVVHYVGDGEPTDPRERTKRRLRPLHGSSILGEDAARQLPAVVN